MSKPATRLMGKGDVHAVLALEQASYEFPWTEGIFRDCLKVGYPGWVCEKERSLVGYSIASVAAGEAHVLNICVAEACRQRGIGRLLLETTLEGVSKLGAELVFLEVRVSNLAAINLYLQSGFREVGVRKGYYPSARGREDGVVLSLSLES
ncbi:MAG: ribosomal protein S18-alanine N-acetyltransferase [bacterium]